VYHEPFLGGGALFFATRPRRAILGDANADVVAAFLAVRDDPKTVVEQLLPYQGRIPSAEDFERWRGMDPSVLSGIDRAVRFLFLSGASWNGNYRLNLEGKFNVPRSTRDPFKVDVDNLFACSWALRDADVHHRSYVVAASSVGMGDVVYLDPPYLPVSNTARFSHYIGGMFPRDELTSIGGSIRQMMDVGATVVVSYADHPDAIRELRRHGVIHRVDVVRRTAKIHGARTESREIVAVCR
jgi:DNA adenine methylase